MKLVVIVRALPDPDLAARAFAGAAGLTLAEARFRLAPEPPALLARLGPDEAALMVAALREAGVAALELDPRVPSDEDRTVARSLAIAASGVTFTPRSGDPLAVAWPDVLAVLRGARASRSDVERTERSKRLSLGAAVATGGLVVTRMSTRTVRSSEESVEQVILVYARDGRAALLAEHELAFSCLGPRMSPSSTANMAELARTLRERATGAYYDERLLRLGRRALPLLAGGESRTRTATSTKTRTDTSGSLDLLAEVMRQALVRGLLP